ncbi:MAG: hypothetical protein KBE65_13880 [Phycisphaerae bacterium]|nr:hypothetical protein [Phycisphaerae bacterium]
MDTSEQSNVELVRTSVPAAVACVLAAVSLLLMPGYMWAFKRDTPEPVQNLYLLSQFIAWFLAGVLGVVGLAEIGTSGGRLVGKGLAWVGVGVPFAQFLLLALFVALFGKTHSISYEITCGTNLSGIGKAMLIYANDYEGELPRAGGLSSQWTGRIADWTASDRQSAYGLSFDGSGGQVSVSASLYLLVKYAEVPPKAFLCGGTSRGSREKGVTEFKVSTYRVQNRAAELIDFWDFGPNPPMHCSYAYHMLYGPHGLTVSSPPSVVVMGDRNPWMDSPSTRAKDFSRFVPDIAPYNGTSEQGLVGNTFRHKGQGQNVMFLDTHVEFEKRPFCGLDDDNIYTSWDGQDKARGVPPKLGSAPADTRDSLLVNDLVTPVK